MKEIKVEHLVKKYKGRTVVDDVSLNVKQGEIIGLLGQMGLEKPQRFIWWLD